jgi:hypothetical protein
MNFKITVVLLLIGFLSACGGGSSSDAGGTTDAGTTDAGTTDMGATDMGTTDAGSTAGSLESIAGFWDASSTGDLGRAEYWDINTDGNFVGYVFTEYERVFDPVQMVNFDIYRCFDARTGTIAAIGNDQYTIDGRFNESGYNTSYQFSLNTDGRLRAVYVADIVQCGPNGCSTTTLDNNYFQAPDAISPDTLFVCPSGPITSVDPIINGATAADSETTWNCSFIDQGNPESEPLTTSVTFGADGSGLVSGTRPFTWTRSGFNGVDIDASYTDNINQFFTLQNIILYSTDDTTDRFTALDQSVRSEDGGAPTFTYFETDCRLGS